VLTAAGVLALLVAGVQWWSARPAPDVGTATVRALATATARPAPDDPTATVPVRPATLPTAPATVVAPTRLVVPLLGLTATVLPTGVDAAGEFAVPASVDAVGWYRYGPGLDATSGSIAIAGHVDSADQGPGAFFGLRRLGPGDRIEVTGADGRTSGWRVIGREEYAKSVIDLGRYLTGSGARRLTLITCGGPFDSRTGHYRDNVVVTAVPDPAAG
jgi:hypothetical protein